MTDLNGHTVPDAPPDPAPTVAEMVWTASMDEEDAPWAELSPEERDYLTDHARMHIAGHMSWMAERGLRIIPPGAAVIPKTDEEAAAMVLAVKSFRESKRRKGGLLLNDKKLILPPGGKLQ